MALLGSSPLRLESVSISTRTSYSPYSAWKCAGLWSLKYIRTTIPKNRVTSGISPLDSTCSAGPAREAAFARERWPRPLPSGRRLRCDRAVTSAVRGGVSGHRRIPTVPKTHPLRRNWAGLNRQPSGSIPVSATKFSTDLQPPSDNARRSSGFSKIRKSQPSWNVPTNV